MIEAEGEPGPTRLRSQRCFNGAASVIEAEDLGFFKNDNETTSFNGAASVIEAEDRFLSNIAGERYSASTGPPR